MRKSVAGFFTGLAAGIIITVALVALIMPRMMIVEHRSRLGFDETVEEIKAASEKNGWMVPKIYHLDESLKKAGHEDIERIAILSLCQPHYAYDILKNDRDKMVTAIMPCRMGVYETKDGTVHIAGMNIGMMSRMFGGNIAKVMCGVAAEEAEMFDYIFSH